LLQFPWYDVLSVNLDRASPASWGRERSEWESGRLVNVSMMLFVMMGSLSVYGLLLVRSKRAKASCFVLERSYRYLTHLLHSSSAQGVWILAGGAWTDRLRRCYDGAIQIHIAKAMHAVEKVQIDVSSPFPSQNSNVQTIQTDDVSAFNYQP
jgi:hypothetical protein